MTTGTHDDDATTCCGLTDQLTPEQIAQLEYCEREQRPPGMAEPRHQLSCARKMAELNIARTMFADIPPPADAIGEVDDWMDFDEDEYQRMFTAWSHAACQVFIFGFQFSSGRVERSIYCEVDDGGMTSEEARRLAAALLDAADELDRLLA